MIKATNKITGSLNASIIKQYPELEDITIKPTFEEQKLKSTKYGFDNVIVEGIPATDLEITPSFEEQVKEGIFKEVTVGAIPQETLNITPTEQEQSRKGIFTEVNIDAIKAQEIVPELNFNGNGGVELKLEDGEYIKKATIYRPESLTGDNIKTGVTIFGITGGLADTSDGTVVANDVVAGKIAYANNQRVVGTIPDNGELEFEPSDEEQTIPSGLTTGGTVKAVDVTTLNEYKTCLALSESILGGASIYTRLEYIESDGNQYIDTGYYPNGNSQYEMSYSNFAGTGCLFGAYNSGWHDGSGLFATVGSNYWFHYYQNTDTGIKSADSAEVIINRGTITINGQTFTISNKSFTVNNPLFIFGADSPKLETPVHAPISMRLNKFIIKEADIIQHNFIPSINRFTGEIGLYDEITDKFHKGRGTGSFIAGPVIEEV